MKEGAPVGKAFESRESAELFRGSLGFDFIFKREADGTKRPICVEINGHDSGIGGIGELTDEQIDPTAQIVAGVRGRHNERRVGKYEIADEIKEDLQNGQFSVSTPGKLKIYEYLHASIRKEPMFVNHYTNPTFIQQMTQDKKRQAAYLPKDSAPRLLDLENPKAPASGYWILKPDAGRTGRGITIQPHRLVQVVLKLMKLQGDKTSFTIQEFIEPAGADAAPPELKDHPASLRLLMDFVCRRNGRIDVGYQTAYQRVSPTARKPLKSYDALEETYVVNRARGATAAPASAEEVSAARAVAEQIIKNIAKDYKLREKMGEDMA